MSSQNNIVSLIDASLPNVFQCASFKKEYRKLFGKSEAQRHEYNKWLLKKLIILCTRSEEDIQETDTFEFLGRGDDYKLYSLRRPEFSGNPRILFASLSNEDGSVYIMLLMFKELHTGDYQRMIPVAKKRMEEILTALKGDLE